MFDIYVYQALKHMRVVEIWGLVHFIADLLLKVEAIDGAEVLNRMLLQCPKISDQEIGGVGKLSQ
ncbi:MULTISPECIES: hypothetical protein [unclassified Sinorhizobium]|uniref:hypothetical protein n=1 Tax=unclassified Sinorhizobium TaxID=2613772 RepID=UPI0024C384FC|nr:MULTISPECIES: hypothetical protein [unclassified Sinorhizobium]MDK1378194.1 hypothetical protein [Sinorhizobium sp. 6-70]MDK1483005.1 hypothetical protein [Sinorhizobium sp. 6-117]